MATPQAPAKKDNVFTRHIGPLPMWVWLAIVGGVVLLYAWYKRSQANSQASTSTSSTGTAQQPPTIYQAYTTNQVNTPTPVVNVTTPPEQAPPTVSSATITTPPIHTAPLPPPQPAAEPAPTPVTHHTRVAARAPAKKAAPKKAPVKKAAPKISVSRLGDQQKSAVKQGGGPGRIVTVL